MERLPWPKIYCLLGGLLWFSTLAPLSAQFVSFQFDRYSQDDGLSNGSVSSIVQDPKGFLWVGTDNGLNRFDGTDFKVYGYEQGLTQTKISALLISRDGFLWIGTPGGLFSMDLQTEEILPFRPFMDQAGGEQIRTLYEDQRGIIWFGSSLGLTFIPPNRQEILSFPAEGQGIPGRWTYLYDFAEDSQGRFWIASTGGLWQMLDFDPSATDAPQASFRRWIQGENADSSLLSNRVLSLEAWEDGSLWMASYDGGVSRFYPDRGMFEHYQADPADPFSLSTNVIHQIITDEDGGIWITAWGEGLQYLEPGLERVHALSANDASRPFFPNNFARVLFRDREGGIWVGCSGGGLYYYNPMHNQFAYLHTQAHASHRLSQNIICALLTGQKGERTYLWAGTHGDGLNQFYWDESTQQVQTHHFPPGIPGKGGLSYHTITALAESQEGDLWIGTFQGINLLPARTRFAFEQDPNYPVRYESLPGPQGKEELFARGNIWCLEYDLDDRLWIGTGEGLYWYEKTTGEVSRINQNSEGEGGLNHPNVRDLALDPAGNLWAATSYGVNRLSWSPESPEDIKVRQFYPDIPGAGEGSFPGMSFITFDASGRLWAAMENGGLLALWLDEDEQEHIKYYTRAFGLPNDDIKGLIEDGEGRMWATTGNGLFVFDPDELLAKGSGTAGIFQVFGASNGLGGEEFCPCGVTRSAAGKIYLGGTHGLNIPLNVLPMSDSVQPPVVFTGLRILDRDIASGDLGAAGDTLYKGPLHMATHLDLSYKDYGFTLYFASLAFQQDPGRTLYYKMEGLDEDWLATIQDGSVSFTNLDPGDYTLLVGASRNPDPASALLARLNISIQPPPWRTWWAYLLYASLFAFGVLTYIRYKIREREKELEQLAKIERAKVAERDRVRKETASDFHDELGNKMTKISLFAEMARRAAPQHEQLHTYLAQVEKNTQFLSEGFRDFLWVLDPGKASVADTLVRIKDFGDQLFEHTEIQFQVKGLQEAWENLHLSLDQRRQIVLIFKEAMHNALKYAAADKVLLSAGKENGEIYLSLQDNGQGFEEAHIKKGVGLDSMRRRAEKIGGQLEVSSQLQSGTQICLRLSIPVIKAAENASHGG
ncbi:MAG: two-component regulator propeller domain-containing protein [Bacteroidota bacterium]